MTAEHDSEHPAAAPDWQDWRQWVEGTDWSDWRSWLRRIAAADWGAAPWPGTPWEQEAGTRPIPLWNPPPFLCATRFGEGFGTLYTAEYRPGEGLARYYWPGPDPATSKSGSALPSQPQAGRPGSRRRLHAS